MTDRHEAETRSAIVRFLRWAGFYLVRVMNGGVKAGFRITGMEGDGAMEGSVAGREGVETRVGNDEEERRRRVCAVAG
jgi:hypothetical protein